MSPPAKKPVHAPVGFHVPSTSWHGVMSSCELSSIHGTAGCMSACTPVSPHSMPVDTIEIERQLPSSICTNAEPPESPEHVETPSPPMLIVLPNVLTTVVIAQCF